MDVFKVEPTDLSSNLNDRSPHQVSFHVGTADSFHLSFFESNSGTSDAGPYCSETSSGESPPSSGPELPPVPSYAASVIHRVTSTGATVNVSAAANSRTNANNAIVLGGGNGGSGQQQSSEQLYAAADSNSSTPPPPAAKQYVPCKVCGDKASGYHYGVTSCEGCKGFFRRSIQKQIEYRCLRDGKCLVIRLNRNRCQYCRFKKCLAVGMSRDSVRYGRVPKKFRERQDSDTAVGSTSDTIEGAVTAVAVPEPAAAAVDYSTNAEHNSRVYDLILMVSQAHHAHSDYTEELTRGLKREPVTELPPVGYTNPDCASSTMESHEFQRFWYWQQFATFVTPTVSSMVEFAKRVPGFADINQDDQLILIKNGFFELWLVQVAKLVSESTLTFFDGTYFTRQQLAIIFDKTFVDSVFEFSLSFNSNALNDTELGLFAAVILLTPDRQNVVDIKSVQYHQDKMIEALKVQVGRNHASEPHVLSQVLLKIPELRDLGNRHSVYLDWFKAQWAKQTLPPLFAEIYDIPKAEDEIQC